MKHFLKSAALTAALLGGTSVAAQAVPPATVILVDMDAVINTSAAGKVAAGELKTKADALQARVASLQTQFGSEEATLQKTAPPQTAAPAVLTAFQAKVRDYGTRRQTAENDINNRKRDFDASRQYVIKQLNDGAQPIISTIMRERGASIVLAEGATLQHTAALDVTPDVIARLDKAVPRVSTTAPAVK